MRIVKMPGSLKSYFSGNDLSGWMDGIAYTPPTRRRRKEKKRKKKVIAQAVAPKPKRVAIGGKVVSSKRRSKNGKGQGSGRA